MVRIPGMTTHTRDHEGHDKTEKTAEKAAEKKAAPAGPVQLSQGIVKLPPRQPGK